MSIAIDVKRKNTYIRIVSIALKRIKMILILILKLVNFTRIQIKIQIKTRD